MIAQVRLINLRNRFLAELEQSFGERDHRFDLGYVNEAPNGTPRIRRRHSANIIDIELTSFALHGDSEDLANWQLAHECVHLLDPCIYPEATIVLEEGIASWFQDRQMPDSFPLGPEYDRAARLVAPFMEDCCLPSGIRLLRKCRLRICDITRDHLAQMSCQFDDLALQKMTTAWNA